MKEDRGRWGDRDVGGCWREKTIVTTLEALEPGARAGLHFLLRSNTKATKNEAPERERLHSSELLFIVILKEESATPPRKEAASSHVQQRGGAGACRPISQPIIFRPELSPCTVGQEQRLHTFLLETHAQQISFFSLFTGSLRLSDGCLLLPYRVSRRPGGGVEGGGGR